MAGVDWAWARPATPASLGLTRRGQLQAFLASFATAALLSEARAAVPGRRTSPARWIDRQHEIAQALANGVIRPAAWMQEVEQLAREVDVKELMAAVNQARIKPAGEPAHNDPRKRHVRFLDAAGEPRSLAYGAALFDFLPHNVITPHGHRNMVSAHMVVDGRIRIRNFDRLRDADGAMVLRPTLDYVAGVGRVSAMSSERDNIHWFVPQGGAAATFDVVISGLDPAAPEFEIKAVDPVAGRRLPDGSIVAPIISFAESSRRYTAGV
jgi:hypothetical protein